MRSNDACLNMRMKTCGSISDEVGAGFFMRYIAFFKNFLRNWSEV